MTWMRGDMEERSVTLNAREWQLVLDEMMVAEAVRPGMRFESEKLRRTMALQLAGQNRD